MSQLLDKFQENPPLRSSTHQPPHLPTVLYLLQDLRVKRSPASPIQAAQLPVLWLHRFLPGKIIFGTNGRSQQTTRMHTKLGGGNSNMFYVQAEPWGRWTHFSLIFFNRGWCAQWKTHQLKMYLLLQGCPGAWSCHRGSRWTSTTCRTYQCRRSIPQVLWILASSVSRGIPG